MLSFAQWLVLRKRVEHAGWWIPANMVAWLAGMPIIFWGIDAAQKSQPPLQAVLLLAGVLFLTGAVVGAIHGAFLVKLAGTARRTPLLYWKGVIMKGRMVQQVEVIPYYKNVSSSKRGVYQGAHPGVRPYWEGCPTC